ncbi:flagellar basal-body MS-ring/collar protein FliF [Atopomonas sediminilitoris]|uniref:flagellar basal-body MS-ring/collar protein FliF n=1 Tax=Atopomonas sediminilitoris TaxID=2919919 RepID=UPI001F4D8175|nr:flagellar basal-body MS-ring/collar protein FliF [Atopomonas sediminilitoris]MCJ8167951.1 flagellar M-ring protein FliF [Atopomonas sediminilitoris]
MATATDNPAAVVPAELESKPLFGLTFLENLSEMSLLRQLGLMVGLAASVAVGFAVVLWSQQPDYRPLSGSLAGVDSAELIEVLTAADIGFRMNPDTGVVMVKSSEYSRAQMKLAQAGVKPQDGLVGYEAMDRDQPLGTSQFMEGQRMRRSLEGELARTISGLMGVKSSRVHLAIPKSSVFVRDNRKPSASVLVDMYPGRTLEPGQVSAIINLVANSVPELDKGQVSVVDQKGNLLSDQEDLSGLTVASRQYDYSRRIESMLTQRVQGILNPVLGDDRYKAEVSADVDFNAVESTSELYNPDQPALRSEQTLQEKRKSSDPVQGIPGALSNQPPGASQVPETAEGAAAAPAPIDPVTGEPVQLPPPSDTRAQATRNYELDRSISYTKQQQGRVTRLSVAVVVDDQVKVNAETGEVTRVPWKTADLARFTRLVQDAVGFNASRGDSVSVINTPFVVPEEVDEGVFPFWQQPWFWDIIKQLLGIILILVLVYAVLRPVFHNIIHGGKGGAGGHGGHGDDVNLGDMAGLSGDLADDRVSIGGRDAIMLPSPTEGYDAQLNAIKGLVAEDPGRVAQVVKEWINADE